MGLTFVVWFTGVLTTTLGTYITLHPPTSLKSKIRCWVIFFALMLAGLVVSIHQEKDQDGKDEAQKAQLDSLEKELRDEAAERERQDADYRKTAVDVLSQPKPYEAALADILSMPVPPLATNNEHFDEAGSLIALDDLSIQTRAKQLHDTQEAGNSSDAIADVSGPYFDYTVRTFNTYLKQLADENGDTILSNYRGVKASIEASVHNQLVIVGLKSHPAWNFTIHIWGSTNQPLLLIRCNEANTAAYFALNPKLNSLYSAVMFPGKISRIKPSTPLTDYKRQCNENLSLFLAARLEHDPLKDK